MQKPGILAWALVSAGLMVVGAFGPWLNALGVLSLTGWDVQKKEAGGLAAIALLGGVMVFLCRWSTSSGVWALFAGFAGLALTGWEHHRITSVFAGVDPRYETLERGLIHIGWGLEIAIAASVSLMLAGLASFFFESAPQRETTTPVRHYDPNLPAVPAGWYSDPNDASLLRYWNGFGWTTQTAKPAS